MTNGEIANSQITQRAGNYKDHPHDTYAPWQARLNNPTRTTWIPVGNQIKLVVDLSFPRRILAIDAHGNKDPRNPAYPPVFRFEYLKPSHSDWTHLLWVSW